MEALQLQELFADDKSAIEVSLASIRWLTEYRDVHNGLFPVDIFNGLIRLRPSNSPEVIIHKVVDGEPYFWLTFRQVDARDEFNGMWHYTGAVGRYYDYLLRGIQRVIVKEAGTDVQTGLVSCENVGVIYPVFSPRADIMCVLFLCKLNGEPQSAEEGKWFSAEEIMRLEPMRVGRDGIIPSHLVGIYLCLQHLGKSVTSPYLEPSPYGLIANGDNDFRQLILVVDDINAEMVKAFPKTPEPPAYLRKA